MKKNQSKKITTLVPALMILAAGLSFSGLMIVRTDRDMRSDLLRQARLADGRVFFFTDTGQEADEIAAEAKPGEIYQDVPACV